MSVDPVGGADARHVDERVGVPPVGVAHLLEVAEVAVGARLGDGVGGYVVGQQLRELAAQATPVGEHVGGANRLGAAGAELDVHVLGQHAGGRLDRLGVEAQLQHVAGLGLLAGELGVDRFVGERAGVGIVDPAQEVGDAPDALVDERHLEHDVVPLGKHVTDTVDPVLERLVVLAVGHDEDRQPLGPIPVEHRLLVFEALVEQHLRHLAERARRLGRGRRPRPRAGA